MNRLILHIDFDSFFASVEQQKNPAFRGKPLGVTATNGRTCIIASSREAKKLGIGTGSRSFDAEQICPSIILTPANFVEYFEISKKFVNICKDFSPFVELFSIDELFMDVTKTAYLYGGVYSLVKKLKERISKEIGEYITVSVGLSFNKLLAKLGSGLKKPNGFVVIGPLDVEGVYMSARLTDICGIGERIKRRLNKIGIYTLINLRDAPLPLLLSEFGNVEGHFLKNVGLAKDESPVVCYTDAPCVKSVGRNYCLPRNEYDQRIVLQNVFELCEEVALKLRKLSKEASTVGLSLHGSYFSSGRKTIDYYIDSGKEVFLLCKYLYDSWYLSNNLFERSSIMVRQISVWASGLRDKKGISLGLFENKIRKENITKVVDKLNERFGHHTIRNGFLLYASKLTTVPNGYLADRYERIKFAKDSKEQLAAL